MTGAPEHRFPIYIVSKSRWDSRLTQRQLDALGVTNYRVIVEAEQFDRYAEAMGSDERLLVLDPKFQDEYDTFDSLGRTKSLGPGPARNHAWADSVERGYPWHWVMDDNIHEFMWFSKNHKVRAADGGMFAAMEDFSTRYRNVAMSGPQYMMFVTARGKWPPIVTGTRIYSCNLIRNAVPYRWRGRYNEDTDLSLRMLKGGWATVQFNAFLQLKAPTQTVKGGNTEEFYAREGTLAKSEMLAAMHPDVAKLKWRYNRPHHLVDYSRWRGQRLIPDPVAPPPRSWRTEVGSAPTPDREDAR